MWNCIRQPCSSGAAGLLTTASIRDTGNGMREKWASQTSDPGGKMRLQMRMRTQMWMQWRAEHSAVL